MDLMMPDTDGIELLHQLAEDDCKARIIVLSGTDTRVLQAAKRLGEAKNLTMLGVLEKPILKSINCDTAQGYLFSKPVAATDFLDLLKRQ